MAKKTKENENETPMERMQRIIAERDESNPIRKMAIEREALIKEHIQKCKDGEKIKFGKPSNKEPIRIQVRTTESGTFPNKENDEKKDEKKDKKKKGSE